MKTKILLALVVVLVSGLVIGFLAGQEFAMRRIHRFISGGPAPFEQMLVARLTEILGLSKDQIPSVREKVSVVTQEFERDFRQHGDVIRVRMTQLMNDIRPLLNDAQQRVLDKMDVDDLRPGPPPHGPREGKDSFLRPPSFPPPEEAGLGRHSWPPPKPSESEAESSR